MVNQSLSKYNDANHKSLQILGRFLLFILSFVLFISLSFHSFQTFFLRDFLFSFHTFLIQILSPTFYSWCSFFFLISFSFRHSILLPVYFILIFFLSFHLLILSNNLFLSVFSIIVFSYWHFSYSFFFCFLLFCLKLSFFSSASF